MSSAAAFNSVEEVKHWEMGSEVPVSDGAGVPQVVAARGRASGTAS